MRTAIVAMIKTLTARFPRRFPIIWFVQRAEDKIAITFDDGPGERTREVLACLAAHDAKATFFVLGSEVDRRPEILREVIASGHEIGIHGYEHTVDRFDDQVTRCRASLAPFGVEPRVVRTPGCVIRFFLAVRLWLKGYLTVIHSFDAHDSMRHEGKWTGPAPDYDALKGGDIILMHDDNPTVLDDLPLLFDSIRRKQLQPVTVSTLLGH